MRAKFSINLVTWIRTRKRQGNTDPHITTISRYIFNCHNNSTKGKSIPVHAIISYAGVELKRHWFSTWALGKGQKSVLRPGAFSPTEKSRRYGFNRRFGGPRSQSGRISRASAGIGTRICRSSSLIALPTDTPASIKIHVYAMLTLYVMSAGLLNVRKVLI